MELTPRAQFAVLLRSLYCTGYDDALAGHAAMWLPDGTGLASPFELTWGEVRASDLVLIDASGNKLDGRYNISPARRYLRVVERFVVLAAASGFALPRHSQCPLCSYIRAAALLVILTVAIIGVVIVPLAGVAITPKATRQEFKPPTSSARPAV